MAPRNRNFPTRKRRAQSKQNRPERFGYAIFCEGGNTEEEYFKDFRTHFKINLVNFEYVGGIGDPRAVVDAAVQYKNSLPIQSAEMTETWAIFDRDDHNPTRTS